MPTEAQNSASIPATSTEAENNDAAILARVKAAAVAKAKDELAFAQNIGTHERIVAAQAELDKALALPG